MQVTLVQICQRLEWGIFLCYGTRMARSHRLTFVRVTKTLVSVLVIINFSILKDQEISSLAAHDLLPYIFDMIKYVIIEGQVGGGRWEAQDAIVVTRG